MMDLDDLVLARCERCQRLSRVADPDRAAPCPSCGGVLRAEHATHHLTAAVTCAHCGAVHPHGGTWCEECGAALVPIAPVVHAPHSAYLKHATHAPHAVAEEHLTAAATCTECGLIHPHGGRACEECGAALGPPTPVEPSADEVEARHAAQRDLRRGYGWITTVAWLYRVSAAAYAIVTLIAVVALSQIDVPLGPGLLVVALSTLMTAGLLMGALQLWFRPFGWTVAVATLAVLLSVVHLVGPNPRGLALPLSACCAVAFLAALPVTRRFQRLIAEHTDTYVTHHASRRTKHSLEGRSNKERHERLVMAMHNAHRRAWRISAAVAAVLVLTSALGAWTITARWRPQALPVVVAGFEEAWNRGGIDAAKRFLLPEIRGQRVTWLSGMLAGHGLARPLPTLAEPRTRAGEDITWVDFDLGAIAMETGWARTPEGWAMITIQMPEPPLGPALQGFLKDWRRSDTKAIGALFPVGYEERMQQYLERSMRRRGWSRLPEVTRTEGGVVQDEESAVTLFVDDSEVTIKWALGSDGVWGLKALSIRDQ